MYIIEDKIRQYQRITGKKLDPAEIGDPGTIESRLRPLVAEIMTLYLDEKRNEFTAVLDDFPRYSTSKVPADNSGLDLALELKRVKVQRAKWQLYLPADS